MSEDEFWRTTPRYFDALVKAYDSRQKTKFEYKRRSAFMICSPYLKKNATLERFWPSPWAAEKVSDWPEVDPAILANFNRNADDLTANLRAQRNGDN